MLVNPFVLTVAAESGIKGNPIFDILTGMSNHKAVKYSEGMFESPFPFNGNYVLWGSNGPYEQVYPRFAGSELDLFGPYGVADSPEQFRERYGETLEKDPRPLCVLFTHVFKYPENAGKGGGWRWHMWGEYIGKGTPQQEYLDDEEGFEDGVTTYHIYDVTGLLYEGAPDAGTTESGSDDKSQRPAQ